MRYNRVKMKYNGHTAARRYKFLIRECVKTVLQCENVNVPCRVDVTITDNGGIRVLNKKFMRKDRPTDVLSFPMQELTAGAFSYDEHELDADTGRLPLGDIVISLERAKEQAREYGHPLKREIAYLTVHSMLHLLGYDHVDEGEDKKLMRSREETALGKMGITRE